MRLEFLEKELPDGNIEISIVSGKEELKLAIGDKFVFPEKMILTKEQKEENKEGLRDLLTGAFCFQEIPAVLFVVKNEKGEQIYDYTKSLYDDVGNVEYTKPGDDAGDAGCGGGDAGGGDGGGKSGCC